MSIRTTTVGSYPIPEWLAALPSEQAIVDATRMVFALQRQCGIDMPTDGEFSRFDVNHPDTNGMIEYFVRPLSGVRTRLGRRDHEDFAALPQMRFRSRPAAVVEGPLSEGGLNLITDCQRAASVAGGPFKFTITSPYMLSRTLLDKHYGDTSVLTLALADIFAGQVRGLPCECLQIDEANIPGNPADGPLAAAAINRVLDAFGGEKAVHLCFGNYGGQVVQKGEWKALIGFLNSLRCNHLVLELAHRPFEDMHALKEIDPRISLGLGVVDVKVNHVETPDEVAARIERIEQALGPGRLGWVHPDCGFWMLKRSVVDRKLASLSAGLGLYAGRQSKASA